MAKKIDEELFFKELQSYGNLIGEHFGWKASGELVFYEDTPQHVVDGVNEVYKNHKRVRKNKD